MGIQYLRSVEAPRLGFMSPRKWLIINNFVMSICSIALFGFSVVVCGVLFANPTSQSAGQSYNSLYNWLILAFVGLALTTLCIIAMRGAHLVSILFTGVKLFIISFFFFTYKVSIEHLMFFFWGISFFVPPLVLETVICFNFYQYLSSWFQHHWQDPAFYQVMSNYGQLNLIVECLIIVLLFISVDSIVLLSTGNCFWKV